MGVLLAFEKGLGKEFSILIYFRNECHLDMYFMQFGELSVRLSVLNKYLSAKM